MTQKMVSDEQDPPTPRPTPTQYTHTVSGKRFGVIMNVPMGVKKKTVQSAPKGDKEIITPALVNVRPCSRSGAANYRTKNQQTT